MLADNQLELPPKASGGRYANARGVVPANALSEGAPLPANLWSLEGVAGRFIEVAGGACLTLCARLILEAQQGGKLAAWAGGRESSFSPPDFAALGINLGAFAVVRVGDGKDAWRVCDTLLRSGGFALVVVDVNAPITFPLAVQTRLTGLAKRHHTALVALTGTNRRDMSCGSLVSLRVDTERHRAGHNCFVCTASAVKDKRRVPGWAHVEMHRGTDGLC